MEAAAATYLDVTADVTLKTFRPASRKIIWWAVGRSLVLLALATLVLMLLEALLDISASAIIITAEVAAGWLLLLLLLLVVGPRARRIRALSEGRMRFLAREDGYTVDGPFGTQTFVWSMYKKAYVDNRFIYLILSKRAAQVIPLDRVPDPQPLLAHLRKMGLLRPTPKPFLLF